MITVGVESKGHIPIEATRPVSFREGFLAVTNIIFAYRAFRPPNPAKLRDHWLKISCSRPRCVFWVHLRDRRPTIIQQVAGDAPDCRYRFISRELPDHLPLRWTRRGVARYPIPKSVDGKDHLGPCYSDREHILSSTPLILANQCRLYFPVSSWATSPVSTYMCASSGDRTKCTVEASSQSGLGLASASLSGS